MCTPTQITQWKAQLLERAASIFEGGARSPEPPVDLKALHAKLSGLALENNFLEGAHGKAGLRSARRLSTALTHCWSPAKPSYLPKPVRAADLK